MLDANCAIAVLNNLGYKTIADWLNKNLDKYIVNFEQFSSSFTHTRTVCTK